jgi:glucose-6-phosphate isomerase
MLSTLPAWQALSDHAEALRPTHLRDLFAADPARFDNFSLRHGKLLLDFSKQRITGETLRLLRALAEARELDAWKEKLQRGEAINHTEHRAVRHMDLRAGDQAPAEVRNVLSRIAAFCDAIHSGVWRGYSGECITHVVNLGIGGSDLGPRMVAKALSAHHQIDIKVHFVSNLDGADLASKLADLNPRTTLFVVASKTFSTLETLTNARTARDWLLAAAGQTSGAVAKHFVAASTNIAATREFGIADENVFEFWDWVGGRFSLWSAIGLPVALAIGYRNFTELLAGANNLDRHFIEAPAERNLPLTLALLSLWNTDFLRAASHGIFPYSQSLSLLPRYLQQLEMESNGKLYDRDGAPLDVPTCPIIWGEAGTNGQHSFFQLLHQGGQPIPSDFIALGKSDYPLHGHHTALLANCLAQSAALAFGQTAAEARASGIPEHLLPYRTFPGNQPSTTLVLGELTPYTLGQMIALYEHKVFCLSVLWGLNAFDQWGVELGKVLASRLTPVVRGEADEHSLDSSTAGLITHLRQFRMS